MLCPKQKRKTNRRKVMIRVDCEERCLRKNSRSTMYFPISFVPTRVQGPITIPFRSTQISCTDHPYTCFCLRTDERNGLPGILRARIAFRSSFRDGFKVTAPKVIIGMSAINKLNSSVIRIR